MTTQKKTLVIHPQDLTTDFLYTIYANKNYTVLRTKEECDELNIRNQIKFHDTIMMLGHGFPLGFWGHNRLIINDNNVEMLRHKKLVGIWCHANLFFEKHELTGIYSGMVISEPMEAEFYGVPYTPFEINDSNKKFAFAVRKALPDLNPVEKFKRLYNSDSNPTIQYNQNNFYHAYQTIQI